MRRPRTTPTLTTHQERVAAAVMAHRMRLASIARDYDRTVRSARLDAAAQRRAENARYRKELEEARAA